MKPAKKSCGVVSRGIKALIYFEVVTTIALFIGLGAINLSKAGVGVNAPPALHAELPPTQKQSAVDILLHSFPENIAKSVAEGQVLQIVVFSIIFGIALALLNDQKRRPVGTNRLKKCKPCRHSP